MEATTEQLLEAAKRAAMERKGGFAIVVGHEDRLAMGVTAMHPVRPTLPALTVIGPIRR